MTKIHRILFPAFFLAVFLVPFPALADIWTFNPGLATQRLLNRETHEDSTFLELMTVVSYQSVQWDITLDLEFRWDTAGKDFDDRIWNRRGDFFRPMKSLMFIGRDEGFSAGLERLHSWTPGGGYLVRDLSGYGEIDYFLPGFRIQWEKKDLKVEVGMDRPVDPSVEAGALIWEPDGKVRLIVEGAVDPEAPESFTGDFSGGRPVADSARRLSGTAAGFLLPLRSGQVLDIKAGAHTARLGQDASGLGWELKASFNLSSYYLNRLSLGFGSVECSGGYVPAWFETIYPMRRWGLSSQPLLEAYPIDSEEKDRRMEMFEAQYELGNALRISAGLDRFTDDSMERGRLLLEITEVGERGLQAAIWSQADGPEENLFTEEADLYSRISGLLAFLPHTLLTFSFERSWAFREEEGGIVPLTSVVLGVMYNLSL